jgi:omega-6 fatty acid desaturase (delta-12 desaturase)
VPHFEGSAWTFAKGALSTIDRQFGVIGEQLFFNIIETHVVHHLFP